MNFSFFLHFNLFDYGKRGTFDLITAHAELFVLEEGIYRKIILLEHWDIYAR